MDLNTKKILITGADGFIGSHLTEQLVSTNHRVRAFVQYNSMNSWGWLDHLDPNITSSLEIFSGDIRDPNGMRDAVKGVDVIMHLAALIGIPFSYHSPDSYVDTNIKGTLNVVQAARQFNIEKVIHTSTSEVYGTAETVPISETHPLKGQSPYAATKIAADQIALSFYYSFQTPVSVVRPFNTYGPRQSCRAIIPTIITQIAKGDTRLKLGTLTPTRDFSFVKDIVQGFINIARSDQTIGEVINIGSNFEISIQDTAEMIAHLMDRDIEIQTESKRVRPEKSEVERLLADTSKAKRMIHWAPKYGSLEGFKLGLLETIRWYQDPKNLAFYKTQIYNI